MVMETKDNRNKPQHSEHLSIWFSQSVQQRTKSIMNTKTNTVFGKKMAIHGNFRAKTDFSFCAGGPCNPRYDAPIQFQTSFSGSVPDLGGPQSSYKTFVHSNQRNHQW